MNVGIIGFGRAGQVHLEAWQATPGARVVAIADPSVDARKSARALGVRAFGDPLDMLQNARLDIVSICSPPARHAGLAIAALGRGVDVLCEKPLATRGPAALRMTQIADLHRRRLLLATKFRHVPDLVVARERLMAGAIGEPIGFEIAFSGVVDMAQRWNARRALSGGGVVIDNGCHAFDIVGFLFGRVTRVHATRLRVVQPIGVEDSATILVDAGRGVIGRIDLTWSFDLNRPSFVTVYGTRGAIEVGWKGSVIRRPGAVPEPIGTGYDRVDCHRRMMASVLDVVAGRGDPWLTAGEALRTVAAVEAAYHSLRSGGWVPVDVMGVCGTHRATAVSA
jgi:predicted dehydrogenase